MTDQEVTQEMSTSMVKVDEKQVVEEDSQPTQINIHFYQESVLAKLFHTVSSFLKPRTYSQDTLKQSKRHQAQLAFGVSLLLLGVSSCFLGILLCFGPWTPLQNTGCAFWAGAMAILAGAGAIIYEKYQSICWGRVADLLSLFSTATALAALIISSLNFEDSSIIFYDIKEACGSTGETRNTYDWSDRDWRTEQCKSYMNVLMYLIQGIQAMFLVICSLMLLLSLISVVLSSCDLCCHTSQLQVEEGDEKKMLGEESLPSSPCKDKFIGTINP